jgi:hypothetical protein
MGCWLARKLLCSYHNQLNRSSLSESKVKCNSPLHPPSCLALPASGVLTWGPTQASMHVHLIPNVIGIPPTHLLHSPPAHTIFLVAIPALAGPHPGAHHVPQHHVYCHYTF